MSRPDDRLAELRARNAAMRENVASLMSDLHRRTAELAEARARAGSVRGRAMSEDGLVRVEVDPAGVVANVELSQLVYERLGPERLARVLVSTMQAAARSAREQVEEVLGPLQEPGADLPGVFEGAPSFADLLGDPRPDDTSEPSAAHRGRGRGTAPDPDDGDEGHDSIYGRG